MPGSRTKEQLNSERLEGQPGQVTRRGLLGSALVGSTALVGAAKESSSRESLQVDVVVVGAGFSGLAAAGKLNCAGKSFVVLEARDRVGGRVYNQPIDHGEITEGGGTYIGPTQNRMAQLAAQYQIATYPTYNDGNTVTIIDGKRFVGGFPPALAREYHALTSKLTTLSKEIPVDAPYKAPRAREWDGQTLHTWLVRNGASRDAMEAFNSVADLWGADTQDLSLLYALFYIAAAGDEKTPGTLDRLLNIQDGAQELRFVGGSQLLAQRMAAALGDRVILSAPVRSIDWSGPTACVMADGYSVTAKQVIVAIPPSVAALIRYQPILPTPRTQLYQRWPMASLIKVEAVYDRPFWRSAGLSGNTLNGQGPVRSTFDNSPPSGDQGVLIGFIGGHAARLWSLRPEAERRSTVLASFAELLGDQAALNPVEYFEFDWPSEEWSRGSQVAYMGPGVLRDYSTLVRTSVGPVHWAGTETGTYWTGYMEGAVQAGERAAEEVLGCL
jgi:monoamine oxidase